MQEAPNPAAAASVWEPQWSRRYSTLTQIARFVRRYPLGAFGAAVLIVLVLAAVFAPVIVTHDPLWQHVPSRLTPPGTEYLLGSDTFGRDTFSRIVYGSRTSLYVGLLSVAIGAVAGTLIGIASGYLGGRVDILIQRVVDALMGFPSLVLALLMVVALGASLQNVTLAIAMTFVPRMTRLARSSALSIKQEVYVLASQAIGAGAVRVILRHILPNSLAPVFVLATGYLGTAVVAEASLSFLGLGVPPPAPSWGGMLELAARERMESAPWLAIFPGLALSIVVFSFAFFGDALRDAFDPRLRGR
jgi:peptide/nickel transport system permease protein